MNYQDLFSQLIGNLSFYLPLYMAIPIFFSNEQKLLKFSLVLHTFVITVILEMPSIQTNWEIFGEWNNCSTEYLSKYI
jgi:hypothetical protein